MFRHILKIVAVAFAVFILFPTNSLAATQFPSPYDTVTSDKVWEVKFSHAIDPTSVSNNAVYVTDLSGERLNNAVSVSETNETIIIVEPPTNEYAHGKTYTLHIAQSISMKNVQQTLANAVTMEFVIEEKVEENPSTGGNDDEPTEFDSSFLHQTWNTSYSGTSVAITFHPNSTLTAKAGFISAPGSYSLDGTQLAVNLMGRSVVGEVTVISEKEFTVTTSSGQTMRFTR